MTSVLQDINGDSVIAIVRNDHNTVIFQYNETNYRGARDNGEFITLYCKSSAETKQAIAKVLASEKSNGGFI